MKIGSYKKILQIFWIVLKKYIRQVEWIHFFTIIQSRSFNFQIEISRWYKDMPTSMIYNIFQVWFFTLNTIYDQIFKKAIFSKICNFFLKWYKTKFLMTNNVYLITQCNQFSYKRWCLLKKDNFGYQTDKILHF